MAKSALSNHNEMLLSLFGGLITASCTELLFNLVSLCYDYEHNKDYAAFRAAVLKLFAAKRPFDTVQEGPQALSCGGVEPRRDDVLLLQALL